MSSHEQNNSVPNGDTPRSSSLPSPIGEPVEVSVSQVVREKIGKCILVLGVGGAGGNTVEFAYQQASPLVEYCVINTDLQDLEKLTVPNKFKIGAKLTGSLGAGGNPANGRDALLEDEDRINEYLYNVVNREGDDKIDLAYIIGGLGGGTGSGAVPELARLCHENDIPSVVLCIMPDAEPHERVHRAAKEALAQTEKWADSVMPVDNFKLLQMYGHLELAECHKRIDMLMAKAVMAAVEIVSSCPKINQDMNDVLSIIWDRDLKAQAKDGAQENRPQKKGQLIVLGVGEGKGENRIIDALQEIINSPLLLCSSIKGGKKILYQLVYANGTENPPTYSDFRKIRSLLKRASGVPVDFLPGGGGIDSITDDTVRLTIFVTEFEETPSEIFEQEVAQRDYDADFPETVYLVEDIEEVEEIEEPQPMKRILPKPRKVVMKPQEDQENQPAKPVERPAPLRAAASKAKPHTSMAGEESLFAQAERAEAEDQSTPSQDSDAAMPDAPGSQPADDSNVDPWKRYKR